MGISADNDFSIECEQSYCSIKAQSNRSHLPPALPREEQIRQDPQDLLKDPDGAEIGRNHINEDEIFARVHSLRLQPARTENGSKDDEVSDDGAETISTLSPSTPPATRRVRFAHLSASLASRPLTPQEAWSLYHFETHARGCTECSSRSLCSTGYYLSQDVQVLVCQHDGEICSTRPDSEGKWIRVEIPYGYDRAKTMLGVERKREKKHAPIVSYEKIDSRPSRKRESRDDIYVEPT